MTNPRNDAYISEMQRVLDALVAERLVSDAVTQGRNYQNAAMSAVNGRWGDVLRDVRRGKIEKAQGLAIVQEMAAAKLINAAVANWQRGQIEDA